MKHVVMFSGGIGSWAAAKRVAAEHGTDDLVLLFCDTTIEDPDLYRFLREAADNVGGELVWLKDGRDPWDVFHDVRYQGNSRIAQCSRILKSEMADRWLAQLEEQPIVYMGIDWTEEHRLPRAQKRMAPIEVRAPLCEPPYLTKKQLLENLKAEGIEPPALYREGYPHNNCFSGDTRFVTRLGLRTLADAAGERVEVLGKGGTWRWAEIRSFGRQKTYTVTVSRYGVNHTVRATADHIWFVLRGDRSNVRIEKPTSALRPGERLASLRGNALRSNVALSPQGIAHGIVFGDGCAPRPSAGGTPPASIMLCGEKNAELVRFFQGNPVKRREAGLFVTNLPRAWKEPPSLLESQSYLAGWLAGYFAANGSVAKSGECKIASASKRNLEFVASVCVHLGIRASPIGTEMRRGYGTEKTELHTIRLAPADMREDLFLIEEHRRRWSAVRHKAPAAWRVVSVEPYGVEDVYCAVVPEGHAFTLEHGIYVRNCGGFCVRAGQAQFELLLRTHPDRYAYHERRERELHEYLGKRTPMIRMVRNGETRYLTLQEFREHVESKRQIDLFDWGGCGCFIDD